MHVTSAGRGEKSRPGQDMGKKNKLFKPIKNTDQNYAEAVNLCVFGPVWLRVEVRK